jgi:hypothetical protein
MDGISDPGEITAAAERGLESISTQYKTQEVYQNQNLLGETSMAVFQGHSIETIDVYFQFTPDQATSTQGVAEVTDASTSMMTEGLISSMATFSPQVDTREICGVTFTRHDPPGIVAPFA